MSRLKRVILCRGSEISVGRCGKSPSGWLSLRRLTAANLVHPLSRSRRNWKKGLYAQQFSDQLCSKLIMTNRVTTLTISQTLVDFSCRVKRVASLTNVLSVLGFSVVGRFVGRFVGSVVGGGHGALGHAGEFPHCVQ